MTAAAGRRDPIEAALADSGLTATAVTVQRRDGRRRDHGTGDQPLAVASVTKPVVALAVLVAVEEGAVGLDDPAGPPGSTVRHLLAHAGGYALDDRTVVAAPAERRVYSTAGYEVLADHLELRTAIPWVDYVREAVLLPLGMDGARLGASAGRDLITDGRGMAAVAREWLEPTLIDRSTWHAATAVSFPELDGVVPGFGLQRPCPWGLGVEIKGHKSPHWTPPGASPSSFGHFGAAGSFFWVDPDAGLALSYLSDRPFGTWAVDAWPAFGQRLFDLATDS